MPITSVSKDPETLTFTHHDFVVGGRAEYFLTGQNGEKWNGSWKFTAIKPIDLFEADDGDDNVSTTQFASIEALEQTTPGMEQGLRAAMPQLDALLTAKD
jgi:hypothetical protein